MQGALVDLFQAGQILIGTVQFCLRVFGELGQAPGQEFFGIGNQFEYVPVGTLVPGAGLFDKALKRCDNSCDRGNARRVGAALEGVQCPGQIIGVADGGFVSGGRQVVVDSLQVSFGFVLENLQQDQVNGVVVILAAVCRGGASGLKSAVCSGVSLGNGHRAGVRDFSVRQGVGPGFQGGGVQPGRATVLEVGNQSRHGVGDILQQAGHVFGHEDAAVDNPVQHVLYRPGQLADHPGSDHAAAALEGVERAADFSQGAAVVMLAQQHGQVFTNGIEDFTRFFNKDLQDLVVNQVVGLCLSRGLFNGRGLLGQGDPRFRLQLRLHSLLRCFSFSDGGFSAAGGGQGFRPADQAVNLAGVIAAAELLDQGWNAGVHLVDQGEGVVTELDGLVDYPVQQVFHRPGQLAKRGGADHPATALEGVESPPYFGQGIAVIVVLAQTGVILMNGLQHFFGFFHEDAKNFVVQQFVIGGLGFLNRLFADRRFGFQYRHIGWLDVLLRPLPGGLLTDREAEAGQAVFRNAQDGIVFTDAICQALKIVFNAGDRIGQGVELFPVRYLFAVQQYIGYVPLGRGQHVGGALQRHQRQAAADAVQQRGYMFDFPGVPLGSDKVNDGGFDLLQGIA